MIDVRYTPYLWPLIVVFHIEFENTVPGIRVNETLSWLNHWKPRYVLYLRDSTGEEYYRGKGSILQLQNPPL